MGCDGIWETKKSVEIIAYIKDKLKSDSISNVCENLLDLLIAPDTMSILFILSFNYRFN